ncbi:hypothetical protein [Thermodesulfatator autotrophicus]|uniref:Uncharacterized protein n=1 Tax=Thermodesulfatator autotrophicus TaxID=1795632 RepID=A0A177E748_9BACT|nr:hypothetical protein [Thermodesulfatator autotrophicus]OAG27536.1 hypothetical protein TH606_06515 [Thermodesulfatator autotrophicus]
MTFELLSEVRQAYCVLKQGGPPKKIVKTLAVLIEGALTPCFLLLPGAHQQIETELEYLLEKLGESRVLKPSFILERFRCLFRTLRRDKRIVPRLEIDFSLLQEDENARLFEDRLLGSALAWEDVEVELPRPAPYQPQEKTLLRKIRLYRLKNWKVGVFLQEGEKKPKRLVQRGLFDSKDRR